MILTDITEKAHTEEKLAESEERFRIVTDRSPLPITIVDTDGKFEYFNPKSVEKFGYTFSEIPTIYDWFEKAHPDENYRQKISDAWNISRIKIKTLKIKPSTLKVRCKDGTFLTILFKMVYLDNNRILFTQEDITELVKT